MRFSLDTDKINNSNSSTVIDQAILLAQDYLTHFALSNNFLDQIEIAFESHFDATRLEELRQRWASGNFEALPNIEVHPAAEINGANGAFSAATNKIYLSQEFIAENAHNTQAIGNVLLEEIGHFVDYQINIADSPGDEGEIFAAIAQGIRLDRSTLQAIKAEDDSATVTLDGQVIQLEQNGLPGIPVTDVPDIFNVAGLITASLTTTSVGLTVSPTLGIGAGIITAAILAIKDQTIGWVWVDPNQKYKAVTGMVTESHVSYTDFPTVHDSHDQNTHIKVDPEYDNLLSIANDPGEIEVEWETGIHPSEHVGDGANPIFPKWVWPSVGDRVWVEGNWIYDAGHPCPGDDCPSDLPNDGIRRYKSEIHPPRAFATMRDQVLPMPGTGGVPVHVTATDLYIHGDGGYATEVLNNPDLIADGGHSTRTTPIDVDFDFDILLPAKPSDTAVLTSSITDDPGNTIGIAPILTPDLANNKVHVHVPLAGSNISPTEVYARHINVGWVASPTDLHHLRVSLTKMILHEDMDLDPGDAELTFSWLNVDRAGTNAWQRLSSFEIPTDDDAGPFGIFSHTNTLSDFDDDGGFGNGELNFNGPTYDFYVANNQPVTIRAHAYDQDGLDDLFGNHSAFAFQIPGYASAYTVGAGNNDEYKPFKTTLKASENYKIGEEFSVSNPENQYVLFFRVEEVPLAAGEKNIPPIAVINGPYNLKEGGSITLSGAGSSDPDGLISTYEWDFNYDGVRFDSDAKGESPIFSSGSVNLSPRIIALRVIDNSGAKSAVATSTVTIEDVDIPDITVNTLADENDHNLSGNVSLREAIEFVNPGGTINFAPTLINSDVGFGLGEIGLSKGELKIDKSLTIDGLDEDKLIVDGVKSSRVFRVENGNVELRNFTIADGLAKGDDGQNGGGGGAAGMGGGLFINDGRVTVDHVTFKGNGAEGGVGGTGGGGGSGGNGGFEDPAKGGDNRRPGESDL